MAADEYYDAIGEVISYVLSAEDTVVKQRDIPELVNFVVKRDKTNLDLVAEPNKRYFSLVYEISIANLIMAKYRQNNQILRGDINKFDIDDSKIGDEKLLEVVAFERLRDVNEEKAEDLIQNISSVIVHSDCRIRSLNMEDPLVDEKPDQFWDGVRAIGLLYPYEDEFKPRDYEQVAQEVISVGNQLHNHIEKLNVLEQIGFGD